MQFVELKLCEKVGNILIECQNNCRANRVSMLFEWLVSETFYNIIDGDIVLCSQAKSYVTRIFLEEKKEKLKLQQDVEDISEGILYWFGYLTTYWCFAESITGMDIAHKYDIVKILNSYEMYHTLSVLHAIDKVKEDCIL